MKVLFCAFDGKNIINGINVWLLRLLPGLKKSGINVSVIFIIWSPENDCTIIPILRKLGIECIIINSKQYTEKETIFLLKTVQQYNFDIVVAGNMVQASYAGKYLQNAGIPVIGILHNDDNEYNAIVDEFISGKNNYSYTATVAVSTFIESKLLKYKTKTIIKKIPYGAEIPLNKSSYDNDQLFKIIYVGRLAKQQKNIQDITLGFCKIAVQMPGVELYIYGSGPDKTIVESILNDYNNPLNVHLEGNISNSSLQKKLLEAHVIVFMSDFEGIPVALNEAMGCGVVPICKHIASGIPELVIDGITGIFISDVQDLINKIAILKDNPKLWETLSNNAKNHVLNGYTSEKNLNDWINLLHEINPIIKKKIKIPSIINLPAYNHNFSYLDNREPNFLTKTLKKVIRGLAFLNNG